MKPRPKSLLDRLAASEAEYWASLVRIVVLKIDFTDLITSPVLDAIDKNDTDQVKHIFMTKLANVTDRDNELHVTPLAFACVFDTTGIKPRRRFQATDERLNIVQFLIDVGAPLNALCEVQAGPGFRHRNVTPVHLAAWENDERLLQLLLQNGALAREKCHPSGMTPLHVATSCNHPRICEILVKNTAKLNDVDADDNTALIIACGIGHDDIANFLISQRTVDVHHVNIRKWNALHAACFASGMKIIIRLIQMGVDVNSSTIEGYTPLDIVSFIEKRPQVVEIIKQHGGIHGPDITIHASKYANVTPQFGRVTSLHIAAEKGDLPVMEMLLEKGYDINIRDAVGRTPLFSAVLSGRINAVRYLLEKNAEPDARIITERNDGPNALMLAAIHGYEPIARLLITYGASTDGKYLHGAAIVDPECHFVNYLDFKIKVARLLIEKNAPIDILNSEGITPFEFASLRQIPRALMEVFRLQNDLMSAIQQSNLCKLQKCIREGAVLDCRSIKHKTPLQYAVFKGKEDVVNCLIEGGADVNYAPVGGVTALHYAAQFDETQIAYRLLQSGAAYDAQTLKTGKTALNLCKAESKIKELLKWVDDIFRLGPEKAASPPEMVNDLPQMLKGLRNSRGQTVEEACQSKASESNVI